MLQYTRKNSRENGWVITEPAHQPGAPGKGEALFCQGNGYMGIRGAAEEGGNGVVRGAFVSGMFNRFDSFEVTELPNCPDLFGLKIELDGVLLDPARFETQEYERTLDLRNGELVRRFVWRTPTSGKVSFTFRRFVSLARRHLVCQRVTVQPLDQDVRLFFRAGIDGQVTNSGVQHFSEAGKRLREGQVLQLAVQTTQSGIGMAFNAVQSFKLDGETIQDGILPLMDRRVMAQKGEITVPAGSRFEMEKMATCRTTRDQLADWPSAIPVEDSDDSTMRRSDRETELSLAQLCEGSWQELPGLQAVGYGKLLEESESAWKREVWDPCDVQVEAADGGIQTKLRFARYHMTVMAPVSDSRMSIAAKGLSGEGYKGHVFWDTEIFLLPAFTFARPDWARSLLEYRYRTLEGARRKAKENGYRGAMFPWESAWADDGEVTPVWGAADIVTGLPTKIWSGFLEQHITADVAFAVWQYVQASGDQNFLKQFGYEILFSTADFWDSRAGWDDARGCRTLCDVVGPDEYKEHVDNNAFTNTMAWWNLNLAANLAETLLQEQPKEVERLECAGFLLESLKSSALKWRKAAEELYVPKPDASGLIPQNDTFLQKEDIDLTPYKNASRVGTLFNRYSLDQVNEIQVSKQADTVLLLYLLEGLHDARTKERNFLYYEARTLHDSSLSLSTHCALACDLGLDALAADLFQRAVNIDFGEEPFSSDGGIHAAATGGIWQCVVCGFGGLRVVDGHLRIEPRLPAGWERIRYPVAWQGGRLTVTVTRNEWKLERESGAAGMIEVLTGGGMVRVPASGLTLPRV